MLAEIWQIEEVEHPFMHVDSLKNFWWYVSNLYFSTHRVSVGFGEVTCFTCKDDISYIRVHVVPINALFMVIVAAVPLGERGIAPKWFVALILITQLLIYVVACGSVFLHFIAKRISLPFRTANWSLVSSMHRAALSSVGSSPCVRLSIISAISGSVRCVCKVDFVVDVVAAFHVVPESVCTRRRVIPDGLLAEDKSLGAGRVHHLGQSVRSPGMLG